MTSSLPDDKEYINEESLNEANEMNSIQESQPIEGDPEEPGKTETLGRAPDNAEIDKLIGRGLKLPQVQDDGQW